MEPAQQRLAHLITQGIVSMGGMHQAPILIEDQPLAVIAAVQDPFHHHVRQVLSERMTGKQNTSSLLAR